MNKKHIDIIIDFCDTYNCLNVVSRLELRNALEKTDLEGNGLTKLLGVAYNYIGKDFKRKIPKTIIEKKPRSKKWLGYILFLYDTCPVCGSEKKNLKNVTCSYSCSNTYFRSGLNNPNFKGNDYRTICFHYHKKECVVCKENNIVEVHHLDENKLNNEPENLIPLCPTHHKYWHSRYKYIIEDQIIKYINKFKSKL